MNRWRVGTKVPRNIYWDDEEVAVAIGPLPDACWVASRLVAGANEPERLDKLVKQRDAALQILRDRLKVEICLNCLGTLPLGEICPSCGPKNGYTLL